MPSPQVKSKLDSLPADLRAIADELIAAKFPSRSTAYNGYGKGQIRDSDIWATQLRYAARYTEQLYITKGSYYGY